MRDPYTVLDLKPDASEQDIKQAFRRLAKQYHPDHNPSDKNCAARFSEVSTAYELLGDRAQRAKFDRGEIDAAGRNQFRAAGRTANGSKSGDIFSGFTDFRKAASSFEASFKDGRDGLDDFLNDIFGNDPRDTPKSNETVADHQKRDAECSNERLNVTLEEIVARQPIELILPNDQKATVSLPPSVESGQKVQAFIRADPTSENWVEVEIATHTLYEKKNDDLLLHLPIGLDEAVLGAKIKIPTLHGPVQLTIPPASNSGLTMRLRERGLPKEGGGFGDLNVKLVISLPAGDNPELTHLVRRWQTEGSSPVRGSEFQL